MILEGDWRMKTRGLLYMSVFTLLACYMFASPGYAQTTETYCSTDVPVFIPDNTTVTSNLFVPDTGGIEEVIVSLQINHTFIGDLEISLDSPTTTTALLVDNIGGSSDNFGTTCLPFPDFILDDAAATPVSASAGVAGTYFPQPQLLSTFISEEQSGNWILSITDTAGGDDGDLNCWCLEITRAASAGCCVIGNSNCLITDADECIAEGGNYQGDGTSCDNIEACFVRAIPTMSEWGLLALAGILGISGLLFVLVRRRKVTV